MGAKDITNDEKPVHPVTVPAFRISRYPITNEQYAAFVAATGREPPSHWRGATAPAEIRNHPVVYVSWHDAAAFCEWVSAQRAEKNRASQ